ncbi:PLP-dependent transferase [Rhodalgimonas zhirmunskyi]|uniref:PLP-dependent transferase n=1 Tax=Rhodalgimonas zhirmunskyi TaxID=2964767 RepID=A0AAJ1X695_9RHOB|nr:PLP-dependent transferase [Rhodoalgimonas zhirmunskyi]MDQ2095271.1 PLP-dependent transferase [Rhodoalgimonas zhirmunskyi]
MTHEFDTRFFDLLHARSANLAPGDTVVDPLVMTSVFALPDEPDPSRVYARMATPTVEAAEARLSALEAAPSLLFPSGMGAYAALFTALLRPGDRLILLTDGYYTPRSLATEVLAPMGIETTCIPSGEIADAPLDGVKLVMIETPTNPGLDVIDIAALAARCHAAGALLAVDNTVLTPLLQQPLDLGADVVLSADTKAMSGHSDLLLGHVASRDEELMKKIHTIRTLSGNIAGPFEAWMLIRGLETLEVRLARMCDNARAALPLLKDSGKCGDVLYPEAHDQARDPGFLVGITLPTKEATDRFIAVAGLAPVTSFGGLHSAADRRGRWGDDVDAGFLRLSFGVEPTKPLLAALKKGLAAV